MATDVRLFSAAPRRTSPSAARSSVYAAEAADDASAATLTASRATFSARATAAAERYWSLLIDSYNCFSKLIVNCLISFAAVTALSAAADASTIFDSRACVAILIMSNYLAVLICCYVAMWLTLAIYFVNDVSR